MKKIISICLVLFLSACSYSTYYIQTGSKPFPKTEPKDVKLYADKPTNKFTVLGGVAADATGGAESSKQLLKEKAASIGADAVIYVNLTNWNTGNSRIGITGVAIKFVN